MPTTEELELDAAVQKVLESKSRKKLIVAGPGAGKTTLFQKLLDQTPGNANQRLVLTFINNLRTDLQRSLGAKATVNTLHGYCQFLLRRHAPLRGNLTSGFVCHPGLVRHIKKDWTWLHGGTAPKFVDIMRNLNCSKEQEDFYRGRGDYYDAVDFDDSVYRVCRQLSDDPGSIPPYELVLIDEFQDFNKMEAEIVNLLGRVSPIIIAGDDDQALYSKLRGASWDHIRIHHAGGEFEVFMLPFCMRCPEVVVGAVNDVLNRAASENKLTGRIDKPFRYFAPVKGADSRLNPQIDLVRTSVQSARTNYFGRYVEKVIRAIPEADFETANEKHEPCVLIIGSRPYLPQVYEHLVSQGIIADDTKENGNERNDGLGILAANPKSNLGWRILLAHGNQVQARRCVREADKRGLALAEVVPESTRVEILEEAARYAALKAAEPVEEKNAELASPRVLLTSFEGSKGLSAQHVILVGLHDGDLPRRPTCITDIEICKLLVGLTRTKKKCSIIFCRRFGTTSKNLSAFIGWILPRRFRRVDIRASYWVQ